MLSWDYFSCSGYRLVLPVRSGTGVDMGEGGGGTVDGSRGGSAALRLVLL